MRPPFEEILIKLSFKFSTEAQCEGSKLSWQPCLERPVIQSLLQNWSKGRRIEKDERHVGWSCEKEVSLGVSDRFGKRKAVERHKEI